MEVWENGSPGVKKLIQIELTHVIGSFISAWTISHPS